MTERLPYPPRLDPRLRLIASLVPACRITADIGADHGKLSAYLLMTGQCQQMIVSDISQQSRNKARDFFVQCGIAEQVILSGADGLHALTQPVDVVIIAGMGGKLIADILMQPVDVHGAKMILSAQSELPLVRDAINARGYAIKKEHVVKSVGRFYRVMEAEPGSVSLTEKERLLGCNISLSSMEAYLEYLQWQYRISSEWQSPEAAVYKHFIREELHDRKESEQPHFAKSEGHPGVD